jgi:hypothetical protein
VPSYNRATNLTNFSLKTVIKPLKTQISLKKQFKIIIVLLRQPYSINMRILLLVSFTFLLFSTVFSQKDKPTPEITENNYKWGGLILDLGLNQYKDNPDVLNLNAIKSRGVNIYCFYGISFGKSKFTLAPGFGLGLDSYIFSNESIRLSTSNDSLIISDLHQSNQPQLIQYNKSKLATNYFDIPLELRFKTGKSVKKTFRMAIGIKGGVLFNAHTKRKYSDIIEDDKRKEKVIGDFALNDFRYGLTARIGYRYYNLFAYYSLSDLFNQDFGPQAKPFMIGITFSPSFIFDFSR